MIQYHEEAGLAFKEPEFSGAFSQFLLNGNPPSKMGDPCSDVHLSWLAGNNHMKQPS